MILIVQVIAKLILTLIFTQGAKTQIKILLISVTILIIKINHLITHV